jgi:hypothetical protein
MTRSEKKYYRELVNKLTLEQREILLNSLHFEKDWAIKSIACVFEYDSKDIYKYFIAQDRHKCCICGKIKCFKEFHVSKITPFGVEALCKICKSEKGKNRYLKNPDHHKEICRSYYEEHKEEHNARMIAYINDPEHPERKEKHRAGTKKYMKENRDKFRDREKTYKRKRLYENIKIRISHNISTYIRSSLNSSKNGCHWETIVGYTLNELILHLESQFNDIMNWNNYGSYWQIDHIVPIAAFNYISYEDEAFKKCWSLKNLQPLPISINCSKGDKICREFENVELAAQLL